MMRWSKSSPPRKVSPLVDLTSNTPSPTVRIEISNVPPPRSKTAMGLLFTLLVEAVGERRSRRLIDDAQDFEPSDFASILGGLTLAVVEISGNGDDRLGDLLAQFGLRIGLELLEDHRRYLG